MANPGWLLEETVNYYHASQFKDAQGGTVPGSNELTTISAVAHLAYISKHRLLDGYFGAEVLLPLVDLDLSTSSQPRHRARGGRTSCAVSAFRLRMADCASAANGKDGHTPAGAICDTGAFCSIRFCALRSAQNSVGIFVCMEV